MLSKESLERVFGAEVRDAKDNWKMACPFHNEVTPSFFIHKEENVSHCFGCGISGDIAVLAVPDFCASTSEARARLGIRAEEVIHAKLARGNLQTAKVEPTYFSEAWLAPFKKEVHKYVANRGFQLAVLQRVEARFDATLQRQVFPHRDPGSGRLLGCAGRACRGQDPKWLFYWEYRKGAALYAPLGLRSTEPVIVVEGVFDYLWVVQNTGQRNVVSILGSKASRAQLVQLRRFHSGVILGLDNDDAGRTGSAILHRGLKKNVPVSFINWPEHVNDWMDIDGKEVAGTIQGAETAPERALRNRSGRSN